MSHQQAHVCHLPDVLGQPSTCGASWEYTIAIELYILDDMSHASCKCAVKQWQQQRLDQRCPCDLLALCIQIGVALRIFSSPGFWMELIAVYIITFSLRYMERAVRWLFFPNDDMILAEVEAAADARSAAAARGRKSPKSLEMGARHRANKGKPDDSDIDHNATCMA